MTTCESCEHLYLKLPPTNVKGRLYFGCTEFHTFVRASDRACNHWRERAQEEAKTDGE